MISGRDALQQLEQAIAGLRDEENRLDAALASATQDAERLRMEQAGVFHDLAQVRLDAIGGEQVKATLAVVERKALAVLAEKRKALEDITARRSAASGALEKAQAARHQAAGRLEAVVARIDALKKATQTRIASDPAWLAANEKVAAAQEIATRAEAKAKQAEADRTTKGAPYEADRLFMYLWANGFGTSKYSAGAFVRFFDRKVANVCGFIENRPNYAMLLEIPLRLRDHATRVGADVEAAVAERTKIERAALEADGIAKLEADFAAVKSEIDAGNAGIASVQSDLTTLDASHGALVSGDDPEIVAAMNAVANALANTDIKTLYAQAYATPTPDDEKIVRKIEELDAAISKADADVSTTRTAIRDTASRRADLEETRTRFLQAGYDQPGVTFNNESMLGNILGGIIGGLVSSPELWRVILGGYQAPPRHWDGGFGGGWSGGSSGGGSWSGGGSSGGSSGGFGGDGGFTTGGGFGGDNDSNTGGGF